jgi:uncharacterized protein (TIGR00661 family)
MKILYAAQATGNGHLSRAREIIPILKQYGTVDIAVSGTQADVKLPFPILYQKQGTSLMYGNRGGINWWNTFKKTNFLQFTKDVWRFPVEEYDIIFNDFEPVVAWACKQKSVPCIGLSHQGAFISDKTPRPKRQNFGGEFILKNFAPVSSMYAFHFKRYDNFIRTPIIRQEIRQAEISNQGHIAVYLPAVNNKLLIQYFSKVKTIKWKIFSNRVQKMEIIGNIEINPISNEGWIAAAASSEGIIMGAGFEGPAESLFMGKRLIVMPIIGQYEQLCNATALEQMGVPVFRKIDFRFDSLLHDWLKYRRPIQVDYPNETATIIQSIFENEEVSLPWLPA